jgi:UDP-N-acetylglucosamine:LPS N-acetylglucosamine transferase
VIRRSKAIVSKPGGGTLIDSLSSATPVILLEPYGNAEEKNGELWRHLGFGVPFATWQASGYDEATLARLHASLLRAHRQGTDYPRYCVERLHSGAWA